MNEIQQIMPIINSIQAAGGRAFVVGGFVRDMVMGHVSKDIDVEVFGISSAEIVQVLSQFGPVDLVGASFGVFKIHGIDADFTQPRRDSKVGVGHQAFDITVDHGMSIEDAAAGRDFTMNAMSFDAVSGQVIDPFNGQADIANRILRHTSPAFADDPLRVMRGFQFAGRNDMVMAPETVALCNSLLPEAGSLAVERMWGEWEKWAARSVRPSAGLRVLEQTGWLSVFPEISALVGLQQEPDWHPEGDVFVHTCQTVDAAVEICNRENVRGADRVVIVLAALCHDFGKVVCTSVNEQGRIVSPGHADAGAEIAQAFLNRIGCPHDLAVRIIPLVREHMVHINGVSRRTVRRLAVRCAPANVHEVLMVIEADHSGRAPLPAGIPDAAAQMVVLAQDMNVENQAPAPILMGRHLLERGVQPGPGMGAILRAAFDAQLDGVFDDLSGAISWFEEIAS